MPLLNVEVCKAYSKELDTTLDGFPDITGIGGEGGGARLTIRRGASLGGKVCAIAIPTHDSRFERGGSDREAGSPSCGATCSPIGPAGNDVQIFSSDGTCYGKLTQQAPGTYTLQRHGSSGLPELVLAGPPHGGPPPLDRLGAATGVGLPVACLAPVGAHDGDGEQLALQVRAGVDSVLVLCAVLAAILL